MFHRFGGKAFFFVLALLFFILSVQNTWQFLTTVLPDATMFFILCMMIVFEGGFLGWLVLLMHGTENIPRTIIAGVMLCITGSGVVAGAYYELDGQMYKSIAVKIDPGFLVNVPNIVNGVYIATFIAIVLYIIANPHFFARMRHMNEHGTAPSQLRLLPVQQPTVVRQEPPAAQPKTLAPAATPALPAPQPQYSAWNPRGWLKKPDPAPVYTTPKQNMQEMREFFRQFMEEERKRREAEAAQKTPSPDTSYADDLAASVPPAQGEAQYVVNREPIPDNPGPKATAPAPTGPSLNGHQK